VISVQLKQLILVGAEQERQFGECCPGEGESMQSLNQEIVPPVLISHFVSMATPTARTVDSEISHHCAFSLPAVVLTLGRENWPLLKKTYQNLAGDMQVCAIIFLDKIWKFYISGMSINNYCYKFCILKVLCFMLTVESEAYNGFEYSRNCINTWTRLSIDWFDAYILWIRKRLRWSSNWNTETPDRIP
jgi:hypothetical protein